VDGVENHGLFLSQEALIEVKPDHVWQTGTGEWDRYFLFLSEQRFLLRTKEALPCAEKEK
jgi:hypothetical protein